MGSVLIRPDLRAAVWAFYAFARGADDVADDPRRGAASKLAALDRFEAGLDGDGAPEGMALRAGLAALGRPGALRHARSLLRAFRRDARGGTVATWDDLLAYCADSADPVGRFLLDLHGEGAEAEPLSDSLCTALQVLNHLQDIGADHRGIARVYLPGDWLAEAGAGPADLAAASLSPALRRVVDRALDRCDALLAEAAALPGALRSRRLSGESATIISLARALSRRLRREDPLRARVGHSRVDLARGAARGAWAALRPRAAPPAPARGRA